MGMCGETWDEEEVSCLFLSESKLGGVSGLFLSGIGNRSVPIMVIDTAPASCRFGRKAEP